jgi:hypothetical protein
MARGFDLRFAVSRRDTAGPTLSPRFPVAGAAHSLPKETIACVSPGAKMSELNFSLKHHRTLPEARASLEQTVRDAQTRFGGLIHKVEWSPDRNGVALSGAGFTGRVWVDAEMAHAIVDLPLLGALLGAPMLTGLRGLLESNFKQLPAK